MRIFCEITNKKCGRKPFDIALNGGNYGLFHEVIFIKGGWTGIYLSYPKVVRSAAYEVIGIIDIREIPKLKTYPTDDPNVAIAEWSVAGSVVGNGNPYNMSYATFITFRDGLIINYREYWNPMAFLAAMSGTRFDGDGSAK